ncbi:hypothetical protein C2845_PM16G02900 [Panicum miliaceum]|uniref:Uncharacterized protein n=1 Tax=Panicum miliaceum TaxID=4540 RepID=A0A3L6PVU7_PANMI|nr:hypothetical protein C2845_PM16G02900 [Panicum miliaceum]
MDIDGPPAADGLEDDRAGFLGSLFMKIPPAELPTPVQQLPPPTAPPSRQHSNRLLARPSSVPVSRRATHLLIRQLDLARQEEAIGDKAVEIYERMYQYPLPRKTMVALNTVTRIASNAVMAVEVGAEEVEAV